MYQSVLVLSVLVTLSLFYTRMRKYISELYMLGELSRKQSLFNTLRLVCESGYVYLGNLFSTYWHSWFHTNFHSVGMVRQIDRHTFEVEYRVYDQVYRMRVVPHRGPSTIPRFMTDQNEDITDRVREYLGPMLNWHGVIVTPRMLGYDRVVSIDDTILDKVSVLNTFDKNDSILL